MATKVFISWSGDKSRGVAEALRSWLPKVIQSVDPFMSSADIAAGSRPLADIERSLDDAEFGIICVSSDNWDRPWLNFEAGAISKRLGLEETRVSPLLIDLQPSDIDSPLRQFQMKPCDRAGVLEVLASLNSRCGDGALSESDLRETFDMWWPLLEADIERAKSATPSRPIHREQSDKLDEVLTLVRSLSGRIPSKVLTQEDMERTALKEVLVGAGVRQWGSSRNLDRFRLTTPVELDAATKDAVRDVFSHHNVQFAVRPIIDPEDLEVQGG